MNNLIVFFIFLLVLSSCSEKKFQSKNDFVIASGRMPNIAKDKDNTIHLVYGNGDSIMYTSSTDNGITFSAPSIISNLPGVYSFAMRGPQIACTGNSIVVTACTTFGDIYSFYKENGSDWMTGKRVNDVDTIAKEGLMALGADGENYFSVWLDLRGNLRNKIYGAKSADGGKTWSRNILVFASPDSSVCECCKPSIIMKGNNVYVMFRNWLQGNRDMYLIQSTDGGNSFGKAIKLGNGNWKLNGCPMDGGSLAISKDDKIQTIWKREGKLYAAMPGMPEKEIGEGKGCTLETVNGKNVYAWSANGEVIVINPKGGKKILGKGNQPLLKALDNEHIICVWENEKQVHASVFEL